MPLYFYGTTIWQYYTILYTCGLKLGQWLAAIYCEWNLVLQPGTTHCAREIYKASSDSTEKSSAFWKMCSDALEETTRWEPMTLALIPAEVVYYSSPQVEWESLPTQIQDRGANQSCQFDHQLTIWLASNQKHVWLSNNFQKFLKTFNGLAKD